MKVGGGLCGDLAGSPGVWGFDVFPGFLTFVGL